MKSVYVIMKQKISPLFITRGHPKEVIKTRKKATQRVRELNEKAMTNEYWFERCNFEEDL